MEVTVGHVGTVLKCAVAVVVVVAAVNDLNRGGRGHQRLAEVLRAPGFDAGSDFRGTRVLPGHQRFEIGREFVLVRKEVGEMSHKQSDQISPATRRR